MNKKLSEMNSYQVLEYLKDEINEILNKSIIENHVPTPDNPIEFESEKGKFKYEGEGNLYIQPKNSVEFIDLDFKVLPTGASFESFTDKKNDDEKNS